MTGFVRLAAYQADRVTLTAGTTHIDGTLLVDSTDRVNLIFGSPMTDLSITLTSPSGLECCSMIRVPPMRRVWLRAL